MLDNTALKNALEEAQRIYEQDVANAERKRDAWNQARDKTA